MPKVPSISPATGNPTSSSYIHTTANSFVDNHGRTLLLRGVNLSGSSKSPLGRPSWMLADFWEAAEEGGESFIGRPLILEDGSADVHLARLRGWGFNMIRFPVTWESLEHEGPGIYDYHFMEYTIRVLRKCKQYGFKIYIDPHQDIWSRFSGGSGAPYWTIPACGIEPRNFTPTQAAIIHCEYPSAEDPDPAALPAMQWSTNYGRLAAQTIFTLFFAGRDFAPRCVIDGKNIQDWLQEHYINAFGELADRIRDAGDLYDACVIGWDSMNEPYEGLVSWPNLNANPTSQGSTLKKGSYPTPAQSLRLGMGQAQTVESWEFSALGPRRTGNVIIDPRGVRIWTDPSTEAEDGAHARWGWRRDPRWTLGTCIWAQHGVWDVESGYIISPDYFARLPADPDYEVDFIEDYWRPHWHAFASRIRRSHPEAIMFVQPPVFAIPPTLEENDLQGRCAYSGHYYDGLTLVTRHWNWFNADAVGLLRGKYKSTLGAVKIGETAIRKSLQEQLAILKTDTAILGPYPTIIGEIGTPFDMDGKRSYGWTDNGRYLGDYSNQQKALDASLNGADGPNALNYTIWTYCPDSSHMWGDGWNMEDLSLWSPDDLRSRLDFKADTMGGSNVKLLSRPRTAPIGRLSGPPAASALSLSTIPMTEEGGKSPIDAPTLDSWSNPYDFLTDGARAVAAFSRPFPVATIGLPTDIQFNIAKSDFKLTVLVRSEDAPSNTSAASCAASSSSSQPEKEKELATEIYVPIVHFAQDKFLPQQSCENRVYRPDECQTPCHTKQTSGGSGSASSINLTPIFAGDASPTSTLLHESVLDLDVQVTAGRWEVEGQILRWWYPVPLEGEAAQEYTITIRRTEGPIPGITGEDRTDRCSSLWDALCPSGGCVVM